MCRYNINEAEGQSYLIVFDGIAFQKKGRTKWEENVNERRVLYVYRSKTVGEKKEKRKKMEEGGDAAGDDGSRVDEKAVSPLYYLQPSWVDNNR